MRRNRPDQGLGTAVGIANTGLEWHRLMAQARAREARLGQSTVDAHSRGARARSWAALRQAGAKRALQCERC